MKPNIGLNDESRQGVITILNNLLADENALYVKTRNYHWNMNGPSWHDLHLLLEAQYTQIAEFADQIAERTRQLGGNAIGTMGEYVKMTRVPEEAPNTFPNEQTMIANLVDAQETVIRQLREDVDTTDEECHDAGTSDFLTGLMEDHEKQAWMLRSFLEGKEIKPSGERN